MNQLALIMLVALIVYAGAKSYQAWRHGKTVVSIPLLLITAYALMCLWLKLKELL